MLGGTCRAAVPCTVKCTEAQPRVGGCTRVSVRRHLSQQKHGWRARLRLASSQPEGSWAGDLLPRKRDCSISAQEARLV